MKSLKNLFLEQLADMYDAEHRIAKALPKHAKAATNSELKNAFETHLKETEEQIEKLESVFEGFDMPAKGKMCEAAVGLIKEGEEIASEHKGQPTINAALIAAAQKIEHYEIGSYGTLREWASLLGNQDASDALQEILDQEQATNDKLSELARSECNEEALGGEEKAEGEEVEMATPRGRGSHKGSR